MTPRLPIRLAIDVTAACLLVASLAYGWLGNMAHELFGTALFLLVVVHNLFNRRWYGQLGKTSHDRRSALTITLNLLLMLTITALLVTGVVVSRMVFGFLSFDARMTARDLHVLGAYWGVVLVGLHIGLNWQIAVNFARSRFGAPGPRKLWDALGWVAVLGIAGTGLHSAYAMDLGAKLLNRPTLDMWDFNRATPRFFLNWLSIMGLCAVLGHQSARFLRRPLTLARG